MKYIVYKTTNKINGKIYIGVHRTKNPCEFDGYLGCGVNIKNPSSMEKPSTNFQKAVKKYGFENFHREVLFVFDNRIDAYAKEAEIVNVDFVKSGNNYNMCLGGGDSRLRNPIYQFSRTGELVRYWESEDNAIKELGYSNHTFQNALLYRELLGGFFWSRESKIDIEKFSKGDNKKPVHKYDCEGKYICSYESITEAAKCENTYVGRISIAIRGRQLFRKKFYFSSKKSDVIEMAKRTSLRGKTYYVYSIDGSFLKHCISSRELMQYVEMTAWAQLHRVIHCNDGRYKTFQIKLEYCGEHISPIVLKSAAKSVDVYDKDGNLLHTCHSIAEVCRMHNVHLSSVNRVLRGVAPSSNNLVFKYHEE